jgi:hypothetical protein
LAPTRIITNTATQQILGLYIYPGCRAIKNLQMVCNGTTFTTGGAYFVDKNNQVIASPATFTQNVGGALQTYNGVNSFNYPQSFYLNGGIIVNNYGPMFIPSQAAELQVQINGTVLSGAGAFGNYE